MANNSKIKKISVVEQVCDSIKKGITEGRWKPGEKIPSEGEFADSYGVNRLSVRMALQKLNTLGIIETRVGEGSYVSSFSLNPVFHEVAPFFKGIITSREIAELRIVIENASIADILQNPEEEEINYLNQCLDAYNQQLRAYSRTIVDSKSSEEELDALHKLTECDFAFHSQLVHMSGNGLFEEIYVLIKELIREHIEQLLSRRIHKAVSEGTDYSELQSETHNAIYSAIINNDVDAARKLTYEMVNHSTREFDGIGSD